MNIEIFKDIAEQITQTEFTAAQDEFFQMYEDKFENTEENKLEHTQIFTEYVYILERVIEANLHQKYTDEQIELFNETFKDNFEEYKKINPSVVETLYGFIDFQWFKKSILLSKNYSNENYKKNKVELFNQHTSFEQN